MLFIRLYLLFCGVVLAQSAAVYSVNVHLLGGLLQAVQVADVVVQTAEFEVDVEQIVPRLAGYGIRLQLREVDALQLAQGAQQRPFAVVRS